MNSFKEQTNYLKISSKSPQLFKDQEKDKFLIQNNEKDNTKTMDLIDNFDKINDLTIQNLKKPGLIKQIEPLALKEQKLENTNILLRNELTTVHSNMEFLQKQNEQLKGLVSKIETDKRKLEEELVRSVKSNIQTQNNQISGTSHKPDGVLSLDDYLTNMKKTAIEQAKKPEKNINNIIEKRERKISDVQKDQKELDDEIDIAEMKLMLEKREKTFEKVKDSGVTNELKNVLKGISKKKKNSIGKFTSENLTISTENNEEEEKSPMITLDQNKKRVTIKKKTDIETHPRKSVMESPIIKKKKDFKDQSTQPDPLIFDIEIIEALKFKITKFKVEIDEKKGEINSKSELLQQKSEEIAGIKRELDNEKKRTLELFNKIAISEYEINKNKKEINEMKNKNGQFEDQIASLNSMIDDLVIQLKEKGSGSEENQEVVHYKTLYLDSKQDNFKKYEEIKALNLDIVQLTEEIESLKKIIEEMNKEKENMVINYEYLQMDCEKLIKTSKEKREELQKKIETYQELLEGNELAKEKTVLFAKNNEGFKEIEEMERKIVELKIDTKETIEKIEINPDFIDKSIEINKTSIKNNKKEKKEIEISRNAMKKEGTLKKETMASKKEETLIREMKKMMSLKPVEGDLKKNKESYKRNFDRTMIKSMVNVKDYIKDDEIEKSERIIVNIKEKKEKNEKNFMRNIEKKGENLVEKKEKSFNEKKAMNLEKKNENNEKIIEKPNEKIEKKTEKKTEIIEKKPEKIDKKQEKKAESLDKKLETLDKKPELTPDKKPENPLKKVEISGKKAESLDKKLEKPLESHKNEKNLDKIFKIPDKKLEEKHLPAKNTAEFLPRPTSLSPLIEKPLNNPDNSLEKSQLQSSNSSIIIFRKENVRYKTPDPLNNNPRLSSGVLKESQFLIEKQQFIKENEKNKTLISDLEKKLIEILEEKDSLLSKLSFYEEKREMTKITSEKLIQTSFYEEKTKNPMKIQNLVLKDVGFFEENPGFATSSKYAFENIKSSENLLMNVNYSKFKEVQNQVKDQKFEEIFNLLKNNIENPGNNENATNLLGFERFFKDKKTPKYEEFQEILEKVLEEHRKCGRKCPHLKRFYERLGFSESKNNRTVFKIHKRDLSRLPKITNGVIEQMV